jgi:uncharacterized protein YkwD
MKTTMKKALTLAAVIVLMFVSTVPAFAEVKQENAVSWLVHGSVYRGDENGNLNADKGLTRAELAVILMRLDFLPGATMDERINEWIANNISQGVKYSKFTDVPSWAAPHVEYCYNAGYMNGISETQFDPSGQVNPKMVCTVVMRRYKIAEGDWDYDTSVTKAQAIGLTEDANVSGSTITRGNTAIVIYRAGNVLYTETPATTPTPTPTPAPVPTTTPGATTAMTFEEKKAELIKLVNEERVKAGVPELQVSDALMTSAQLKADDMAENDYYSHTSPVYGTAQKMIQMYAGGVGVENYAYGQATPAQAIRWWMNSSLHKAAILRANYTHIGVGIAKDPISGYIWVQHFVTLDTP